MTYLCIRCKHNTRISSLTQNSYTFGYTHVQGGLWGKNLQFADRIEAERMEEDVILGWPWWWNTNYNLNFQSHIVILKWYHARPPILGPTFTYNAICWPYYNAMMVPCLFPHLGTYFYIQCHSLILLQSCIVIVQCHDGMMLVPPFRDPLLHTTPFLDPTTMQQSTRHH